MNLIKKVYNWFNKLYMPPIDQHRIDQKLMELNATGQPGAPHWVPIDGQSSFVSTELQGAQVVFNAGRGIVVKLFMNSVSGELKAFPIRLFLSR